MGLFPRERLPMAPIPERFVYLALAADIYVKGGFIEGDLVVNGREVACQLDLATVAQYLLSPTINQSDTLTGPLWEEQASNIRAVLDRVLPDWMEGGLYQIPGCPTADWPSNLRARITAPPSQDSRFRVQRFDVDSDGPEDPAWA